MDDMDDQPKMLGSESSSEEPPKEFSQSTEEAGPEDVSLQWVQENEDLKKIAEPIPLDGFSEAIKNRDLEMEFRILIRITETNFHAKKIVDYCPANAKLNRYATVQPYGFNRVRLEEKEPSLGIDVSQYINASLVKGYFEPDKQRQKYIATQAPLESAIDTFWQMVFEYNVVDVFCLTRPQENGKCMAFVYWKNTEPESSAEYSVKIKSKVEDPYWVKKEIELENKITKQKKTINHFYVELWEDDKVPAKNEHIDHLISLASYCEESLSANTTSPAVVHCSAGVGRTGVFICMVELIAYLKQLSAADNIPKTISVFDMVRSLREQRWGSVKSFVVHSSDLGSIQIHL